MYAHPLFTQKHYEYLIAELRTRGRVSRELIDVLCEIFKADNPHFKPRMFREGCNETTKRT